MKLRFDWRPILGAFWAGLGLMFMVGSFCIDTMSRTEIFFFVLLAIIYAGTARSICGHLIDMEESC